MWSAPPLGTRDHVIHLQVAELEYAAAPVAVPLLLSVQHVLVVLVLPNLINQIGSSGYVRPVDGVLREQRHLAIQSLPYQSDGHFADVDADPLTGQLLRGNQRGRAPAERV